MVSETGRIDGDARVEYHLRPLHPGARLLEVFCRVREPDPQGQLFSLPAWIPGSYLLREFARHVVTVEVSEAGNPVPLRKVAKNAWRAAPVSGELLIRAEFYAGDPSVRGASLDRDGAFLNGPSVFFRIDGHDQERCVVHLHPGEDPCTAGWQVATTLPRLTGAEWDYGEFAAASYRDLIDHPVLMGGLGRIDFDACGVTHSIVLAGHHDADLERLARDMKQLCAWHIGFFGEPAPMPRYLFLVRLAASGFGGLEHRSSTALVCHRRDLPRSHQPGMTRDYLRFLGLASHEYFHLWNGKRIQPSELLDPDLDREALTRQLWIVEGVTSYYDDLSLLRSGLIPVETYLELLGRLLTGVYRCSGRRRQNLEDASFDAWIKYYRPDENSPNAQISYYAKGAMVALALDLEIRLRSDGGNSLDDVMRVLWRQYGQSGHGLPEGGFEEIVAEVTGMDFSEFFRGCLRDTVDPPVGILLAQFGVLLSMRASNGPSDPGGTRGASDGPAAPWFGWRLRDDHGRVRVTHVLDSGPAQEQGILAEDEVIAIGGDRVTGASIEAVTAALKTGQPVTIHVFRGDQLRAMTLVPAAPPKDTCYLGLDRQAPDAIRARRAQWLGVVRD